MFYQNSSLTNDIRCRSGWTICYVNLFSVFSHSELLLSADHFSSPNVNTDLETKLLKLLT